MQYNKALLTLQIVGSMALLIVGVAVVLMIWHQAASKLPDETAEDLCAATNAIRVKYTFDPVVASSVGAPRLCKKIEKTIPDSLYDVSTEGAQQNLNKLVDECWRMWLEGRDRRIFDTSFFSTPENHCFICYEFYMADDISFSAQEFDRQLDETVREPQDTSDQCAGMLGGFCLDSCEDPQREIDGICPEERECCIETGNPCANHGGECKGSNDVVTDLVLYPRWSCPGTESCYLPRENVQTHRDYVQTFGGEGKIIVNHEDIGEFNDQGAYAITFIGPTNNLVGFRHLPFTGDKFQRDIAQIYISRLADVQNTCYVRVGTEASFNE